MKAKPYHRLALCPCCEGTGQTSAYLGDVTNMVAEDSDFGDAYFAGEYDRACSDCKGSGRIQVLVEGAPFSVRRAYVEAQRDARPHRWQDCDINRAERAMGA